jgi:hypothetical protein
MSPVSFFVPAFSRLGYSAGLACCTLSPSRRLPAGTCALPIKRDNGDGTTSLFARLDLTNATDPSGPATCDKVDEAVASMGGTLITLTSAADLTLLRGIVSEAAGKPVWVAPVDPTSALAVALGYTSAPAPGQMAALQLVSGAVRLVNVPCGTEGVVVMETQVAGAVSAPAATVCGKLEVVEPMCAPCEACDYAVLDAAKPISLAAADAAASALGKLLATFSSQEQYDAVRASLAGSNAAALLASGALAGLWVDMAGSAYRPDGYTLPAAGQASLLAGASLTPTNVPVATTVAAALVTKCAEVDTTIGEAAGPAMSPHAS